jgi:DNA-binding MarR family transcriptional regulator
MSASNPDESIGNLFIQICKLRRNKSNTLLSEHNIHAGQDPLLYYLSLEDGQTISSLVDKLCIQYATISNMIDRMEATGLIRKEKDAIDKRTSRIYLTEKGKKSIEKISQVWQTMEAITLKGLEPTQQDTLRKILQQVKRNLE